MISRAKTNMEFAETAENQDRYGAQDPHLPPRPTYFYHHFCSTHEAPPPAHPPPPGPCGRRDGHGHGAEQQEAPEPAPEALAGRPTQQRRRREPTPPRQPRSHVAPDRATAREAEDACHGVRTGRESV